MKTVLRACCPAGLEKGKGVLEGQDGAVSGFGYTSIPGPQIGEIEHDISERVAWHEAAHAVVGYMAGWPIKSVSIVPPERVEFSTLPVEARDPHLRMVVALAGGAGEDARVSWFFDEPADSVADYVERAFNFCGGNCDGCRAAMAAWQIVGVTSPSEVAENQWRAAEMEVRRICTQLHVRLAIAELVATLMASPRIDGTTAESVITTYVKFGELAGKEDHA
ncbi:MAG: hypothetical protein ACK4P4_02895 [Allorhizobium sp.]